MRLSRTSLIVLGPALLSSCAQEESERDSISTVVQEARPAPVRDSGTTMDTGSVLDTGPADTGSGGNKPKKDAGVDAADVPADRGPDATLDAATDVATDRGPDAGVDAGVDAADAAGDAGAPGPPAFPGAEGFGAAATGGRGGRVIYVTTLAATGPGSLNDALAQTGPRYVLFKVSGVINAEAHVLSGDVTIAGQTSPGGVIVRGFDTTEAVFCDQSCGVNARGVQNIVVRHLRSRPAGGAFPDGLRLRYARNVIVDHVSVGNAADEAVEVSYSNNVTIQNTLLAETVGGHAQYGGMLINYSNPAAGYALDRLSIHHNAWNRLMGRYPELSRESGSAAAGTTMQIELSNNLLWDQRFYIDVNPTVVSGDTSAARIYYQLNWVGNAGFAPSSMPYGMIWFPVSAPTSSTTYFADDAFNRYPARTNYDLNYCCSDFDQAPTGVTPAYARPDRHPFPTITYTPASGVRDYALANVGAFPRDPMDRRLMEPVRTGVIDTRQADANPAGDALALDFNATSPPAAPADADLDGMPDAWELAHGLDPLVPNHNGTGLSVAMTGVAGYTNIECYLNELSDQRVAAR